MSDEHDPVVTVSVLKSELSVLRSELKSELTVLRSAMRSELQAELTIVRSDMTDLETRLERRISEEGATTRAHFDIMVEKVNDSVKLVAEVTAHHSTVLDNHESRLQRIEER